MPAGKRRRNPYAPPASEPTTVLIRDAAWGPDDTSLLLVTERSDSNGALESLAFVFELGAGEVRATMDARSGSRSPYGQRFVSAAWSADGALIALVRSDGIALWDGRASTPGAGVVKIDDDPPIESDDRQLVFAPVGRSFATWNPMQKELRVYDGKHNTKPARAITFGDDGNTDPSALAYNPEGTKLAVAVEVTTSSTRVGQVFIYDPSTGTNVLTLHSKSQPNHRIGRVTSLHWTPKGRGLVTVDNIGRVDLWNATTDDPPTTLIEMGFTGPSALVEDGNVLLVGGGTLAAWDLRSRKMVHDIPGDATTIEHVRPNRAHTVVAAPRGDRVDVYRFSDNAHLTIRTTPTGILVHSDSGLYAGARDGFAQLRTKREGATTRPLEADEATYRPTLAQDFLAGCPMTP